VRKTYVYCPEKHKMVEKGEEVRPKVHHVMPDIQPYQVVGPEYGKVISSRSKHREYLRSHGLVEVGDQKPKCLKNKH